MARPTGKTFAQPVGQWPRHRALRFEVQGFANWPDAAGGEPIRAQIDVHALQAEDDDALRRLAHIELDKALDEVLPVLKTRTEYVVHRMDLARSPYTVAHKVIRRTPNKIEVVCGVFDGDRLAVKGAIFGGENLVTNWGGCKACTAGVKWASPEGETIFRGMLRDG